MVEATTTQEEVKKSVPKIFGENEAGIQEYLSKENVSIRCVIKHRFSDFVVNEIDENGKVIWFVPETDLQKWRRGLQAPVQNPNQQEGEEVKSSMAEVTGEQEKEEIKLDDEKMTQFSKLVSEKELARFQEFLQNLNEGSIEKSSLFTFDESIDDKNIRSQIHLLFKQTENFETDTLMEGDSRRIRVFLKHCLSANKRKKMNIINRKSDAEKEAPQYLQIVIQKMNVDTMQAVHYIAKQVKKYGKHFQIAGNKDKRGVTTQRATFIRGDGEALIRFQRSKNWDPKIKVGTFERVFNPLRLGQLSGNRFSVALRFIPNDITAEMIAANVENLKKNGFINYFGMQRFGTYNVRSHEIGIETLHQNWIKVIHMIISQHPDGDHEQKYRKDQMTKLVFEEANIGQALQLLERKDRLEKSILMVLRKSAINYYNAFQNIARNTRTIFVHAYQSYVWNRAVSERIRRHGTQVLMGDLVIEPEAAKIVEEVPNSDDLIVDQADVEEIDIPDELDPTIPDSKKPKESQEKRIDDVLIEITPENIHKYTINDVVMPICGYRTRMPANKELTDIILGIMAEDKIDMETYEKHSQLDSTSAWGSYRKIIGFAQDIEHDIVDYQNINEDLLNPNYNTEADPKPFVDYSNPDEKPVYKALRLKFSLKQSSYATMLLREVTKMSSAYNVQSALSQSINTA